MYLLKIGLTPEHGIEYPVKEKIFFESNIGRPKKVLIYFVGGITYGEIAAIRYLNSL
jgi:hypothetical protein